MVPPALNPLVQFGLKLVDMLEESTWSWMSVWCRVSGSLLLVSATTLVMAPLKKWSATLAVFMELTLLPLMTSATSACLMPVMLTRVSTEGQV